MKNFYKILVISILHYPGYSPAQELQDSYEFSLFTGFATYQMNDLKGLNELTAKTLSFDVSTVNNYDPGIYFGGSLGFKIHSTWNIGIVYQYFSTGSRIGQKDYSGKYTFDQLANGHFFGIESKSITSKQNLINVSFLLQVGILLTGIELNEYLNVSGTEKQESQSFSAFSPVIYPAVNISGPYISRIKGYISFGGMYDTGGKVHLSGNKKALLSVDNNKIKTEWSGLRVSLGLSTYF